MITIIVAVNELGVMGKVNHGIPWKHKGDLKFFKEYTMGKTLIMGHTTYLTLKEPRLPGRNLVVLTRDEELELNDATVINSIDEVVKYYHNHPEEELVVAGGLQVYKMFLPIADQLFISIIPNEEEGELKFPQISGKEWEELDVLGFDDFIVMKYGKINNAT